MARSLSGHALAAFCARYDGTMATARLLAQELRWTPVEVIDYARELGLKNGEQPRRRASRAKQTHASPPALVADMDMNTETETETEPPDTPADDRDDDSAPGGDASEEEGESMTSVAPVPPLSPATTKLCQGCGRERPLQEFHRTPLAPNGRGRFCAGCREVMGAHAGWRNAAAQGTPTARPLALVAPPPQDKRTLLEAVMAKLPRDNHWTSAQRDRWLLCFGAALDLEIDQVPAEDTAEATR